MWFKPLLNPSRWVYWASHEPYDVHVQRAAKVEKEWLVTLATINPSEVDYEDFVPCARRLARQLKEQEGVELIVALTHMRVPNDELLAHEAPWNRGMSSL